ncbi:MAG: hypothetical protein U0V18_11905 [Anaerolineales bacterium]
MRKSTLFVSAMLTVFLMATMFGVVSAYQQVVKNNELTSAQSSQKTISQPVSVVLAVPTATEMAPLVVTAEEATTIAVNFLNDPMVYSVEVVDYQGAPTYLVTFSSGELVYVSSEGVVVANTQVQPVVITASNTTSRGQSNNSGSSSNNSSNGSSAHEEHEHEEHEGDD